MKTIVNGKYGQYTVYEKSVSVSGYFFNSIEQIEKLRYFRALSGFRNIDNLLNEAIKIIKKYIIGE